MQLGASVPAANTSRKLLLRVYMSKRMRVFAPLLLVLLPLGPVGEAHAQERVSFDSSDGKGPAATQLSGFLYRPQGKEPFPAVVLLHGCGGLYSRNTDEIVSKMRFWAEFLREHGYVALLVDSFRPRKLEEICTQRKKLNSVKARSYDAYGGLVYLQRIAIVDPRRVALMGWSNGSRAVLSAMAQDGKYRPTPLPAGGFHAAIAFYPQCRIKYTDMSIYQPYAPLLILTGELDDWTPAQHCVELTQAAKTAGADMHIIVYPGAHHSFDSPNSRVRYRPEVRNRNKPGGCCGATIGTKPEARDDARLQVVRFLAQHLQGGAISRQ
jgi:dienelactone hydrolase